MGTHCLVLVTVGDPFEGRRIARHLVESKLAAGVQLIPISSVYRWKGEVTEEQETLLLVKTRTERFELIQAAVDELHSYEVPPVLMIDIDDASPLYLDWIDQTTTAP